MPVLGYGRVYASTDRSTNPSALRADHLTLNHAEPMRHGEVLAEVSPTAFTRTFPALLHDAPRSGLVRLGHHGPSGKTVGR